jgi:hypothetical protein
MTHYATETESAGKTGIGLCGTEVGQKKEGQYSAEDEESMEEQTTLRINTNRAYETEYMVYA